VLGHLRDGLPWVAEPTPEPNGDTAREQTPLNLHTVFRHALSIGLNPATGKQDMTRGPEYLAIWGVPDDDPIMEEARENARRYGGRAT
jgi:hypothetical protein